MSCCTFPTLTVLGTRLFIAMATSDVIRLPFVWTNVHKADATEGVCVIKDANFHVLPAPLAHLPRATTCLQHTSHFSSISSHSFQHASHFSSISSRSFHTEAQLVVVTHNYMFIGKYHKLYLMSKTDSTRCHYQ